MAAAKRRDLFSKNIETINGLLLQKKMYSLKDLNILLIDLKSKRLVAQDISARRFFDLLQERLGLRTYSVSSERINKVRYSLFQDINVYDFVNSFERHGFFSMSSALNIQGYSDQKSEFIFYAKEQSPKHNLSDDALTQEAIDHAYRKEYRYTSSIASYDGKYIVYLTPKHTDRFEIIKHNGYDVSSIHRAFVEMIMHVQYFKNFEDVIKIFQPLKEKLDPKKIFQVVEAFDPIYPYFQLIGFSLEKVGFDKDELILFKYQVSDLNFYTQKGKDAYHFNTRWNIYY
ncbi:MAG: hypothetical protein ABXS92_06780 [Sulfurimonas sp.]